MLIAIDASRAITRQRTGTEAYAFYLIQALIPQLQEREARFRLYFNQPPETDTWPVQSDEMAIIPYPRLWTHWRLWRALTVDQPDIFFTPAHVIPYGYRRPAVATVHDLGFDAFPQAHTWRQRSYLRWSTAHNVRRSRRIIADSEATANDLVAGYHVSSEKIRVVYPGPTPGLAEVKDPVILQRIQSKYGIREPYLLYLGTLQPRKNLVRLVRAFADFVRQHNGRYQLVLAGKPGWHYGSIMEAIDSLPAAIRERIILSGYVADDDKAALLSGAIALLYPSLYEGFGIPVLEAQQCNTAVICANSSSLPEVAGDGALLVDPLDAVALTQAIAEVVDDVSLRQDLVGRGRDNVGRFSWERAASEVLSVLEEIVL